MQEFEDYLNNKKIDTKAFKETEPRLWDEWLNLFAKVHPNSFAQQKLFLINKIRRRFPLREVPEAEQGTTAIKQVKPKPKFKLPSKPKQGND